MRTGEKTKLGKSSAGLAAGAAGWRVGSSAAGPQEGAGPRGRGFTLFWEGAGMESLSSLMTSPYMPPAFWAE